MNITHMKLSSCVDGQNLNQKEVFNLCVSLFFSFKHTLPSFGFSILFYSDQATLSSILQVNVWQRSQSKKKSKKRNLVLASGGHHLGELLKKQERKQSKLIFCHFFKSKVPRRYYIQCLKFDFNVELATT